MNPKIEMIVPSVENARELCDVITQSIIQLCAADYKNDPLVMKEWLANKTPENVTSWMMASSNISFAALDIGSGKLVGFILMNTHGEILLNYLLPTHLHQGIGKSLLNKIQAAASELGLLTLSVISTITAKDFYERNGFIPNGAPEVVGPVLGDFPLIKYL